MDQSTLAFHVCKTYYSLVFYMAKNANGMLMGVKAILVFQGGQCVTESMAQSLGENPLLLANR